MVLNDQRQLWFCRNYNEEQPKWLLLSAGVTERKVERKSSNLQFFRLGEEAYPNLEMKNTVKLIDLLIDLDENDEAQQEILAAHGEIVKIVQWDKSKKFDNKGEICDSLVEIIDDGSGLAKEPMRVKVRFFCGSEYDAEMASSVNGMNFTLKNKEVSADV